MDSWEKVGFWSNLLSKKINNKLKDIIYWWGLCWIWLSKFDFNIAELERCRLGLLESGHITRIPTESFSSQGESPEGVPTVWIPSQGKSAKIVSAKRIPHQGQPIRGILGKNTALRASKRSPEPIRSIQSSKNFSPIKAQSEPGRVFRQPQHFSTSKPWTNQVWRWPKESSEAYL